ncbi:VEFS-Box of polycomb protein [Globodera pallida]|nr:VEFS-Box of polycomb protein [Globodera pallida]
MDFASTIAENKENSVSTPSAISPGRICHRTMSKRQNDNELLELKDVYSLCLNRSFTRKVAQRLRHFGIRSLRVESIDGFFDGMSPLRVDSRRISQNKQRGNHCLKIGTLEQSVVRMKHRQSAQLHQLTTGREESEGKMEPRLSGDSLTFEFFNTILPFYAGFAKYAKFDVFLCAISTDGSFTVRYWDHLINFISPINQKTRGSYVLEAWMPELRSGVDLFLVVEGEIVVEGANSVLKVTEKGSGDAEQNKEEIQKKDFVEYGEKLPLIKRSRLSSTLEMNPESVDVKMCVNRKSELGANPLQQKSGRQGLTKPRDHLAKQQFLHFKTKNQTFRGAKHIGSWLIREGEKHLVFQPQFTHNGFLLHIFNVNEQNKLANVAKPNVEVISDLLNQNKNSSLGACHMLKMEVSNEHGYGAIDVEGQRLPKCQSNAQPMKEKKRSRIIYRLFATDGRATDHLIKCIYHLPIWFKSMPPISTRCYFCKSKFDHPWVWAVHMQFLHPSLSYQFQQMNESAGDIIEVEVRKMQNNLSKKNFTLTRRSMVRLRAMILSGGIIDKSRTSIAPATSKNGSTTNVPRTAKNFKGILPFNEPNYTKLKDPPFKHLCGVDNDQGWMNDTHRIRLHQFTDVSAEEKGFFLLWNSFIVKRVNRQLGVCQLFALLKRFIDAHGKELVQKGLMANFIFHCANLENFGYISNSERAETMAYAAHRFS